MKKNVNRPTYSRTLTQMYPGNIKNMKFTSIFYKIRNKLSYDVSKMLYFAFVYSVFLNNKIVRIIQNIPRNSRVADLYIV